jgi:hypothetical protein
MKKMLLESAAGLAGGLLATLLLEQVVTKLGPRLPRRLQPRMHRDPGDVILGAVERIAKRELGKDLRDRLKPLLHFTYGATGPLVLGLTARRLGKGSLGRTVGAGAVMGAIVWAVGYLGWLPATGAAEPIHRQPIGATAQGLIGHAMYGAMSALPVAFIERYV